MDKKEVVKSTIDFVKKTLKGAEGGHDWFHIERVYKNAKLIAEGEEVDLFIVELGSLLHDIADAKFYEGDESIGPKKAADFLRSMDVDETVILHIENIIRYVSFKSSLDTDKNGTFNSNELKVIQDADRLDAIGAIGIARTFNYGGFKNRTLYDPDIAPLVNQDKETYKNSKAPTINHFYEKLLLLKDKMNTETALKIAEKRHLFMEQYLDQFYNEWNGKA
ncbi:HD domain-containing protein [Lutimonas halocynthiae]|uniref:HD domain-containing protein n=1 Tax=Lutimonas halocynthiae TaxID=1446477 RepID=UPI0025B39264|nr:HD domain-containing protein [Lutimonas halocynthiae]MDN3641739.1 HD domain-containing protein [Lutimonas halocynthiae]